MIHRIIPPPTGDRLSTSGDDTKGVSLSPVLASLGPTVLAPLGGGRRRRTALAAVIFYWPQGSIEYVAADNYSCRHSGMNAVRRSLPPPYSCDPGGHKSIRRQSPPAAVVSATLWRTYCGGSHAALAAWRH